jgi:hypothetical protein
VGVRAAIVDAALRIREEDIVFIICFVARTTWINSAKPASIHEFIHLSLDNAFAHSFGGTRQFAIEESWVGNLGVGPLGNHSELKPENPRGIDWHSFAPRAVAEKADARA